MPPFKSEKDVPFSDWPSIGEVLIDKKGDRRLTVTKVNTADKLGRNVIGILHDGMPYSCDVPTLLAMWGRPN
jgi:hypothetical protein